MRIVVLGGAGFVGSAVSRLLVGQEGASVLVIDKLTPASSLLSLAPIAASPRYSFRKACINDRERIVALLQAFTPDAVVHAAAENHIEPGIGGASGAVDTNFVGTWRVLDAVRDYWSGLPQAQRQTFRFVSISPAAAQASPASATRAAADELLLAWQQSYGLPAIVVRSAAVFGCYQFPDKPVPSMVLSALGGQKASVEGPAYPWVHIDDLASALVAVIRKGTPGAAYTVTGPGQATHAEIAAKIARLVERHAPARLADAATPAIVNLPNSVASAKSEPLDSGRLSADTGWRAQETLDSALSKTVRWYLGNEAWWRPLDAARNAPSTFGLLRIA